MQSTSSQRALAAGLAVLGAGLAAVALLGPLTGGPVAYHVTETLRNQTIGLDAASLVLVAPLSLLAAALTWRGRPRGPSLALGAPASARTSCGLPGGPALALGVGAYAAYLFAQYIVGQDYLGLPGDNERLFPL